MGSDVLDKIKAKISYEHHTVSVNGKVIPASFRRTSDGDKIKASRVLLSKRVVVAPHTRQRVNCHLESPITGALVMTPRQVNKNISKTRTTPYRPSADGQVERYNRILLGMISTFLRVAI